MEELGGERLRRATAVQVCMTCLDTDSNMYSMSEYKLVQAYEDLTGYPLFDMGNLKHTLCEDCAPSLTNFNKFRDKSLRARALLMDFVKQHKVVTAAALRPLQAALPPRGGEGEPAVKAEGEGEPAGRAEGEGGLGADSVLRDAKLLDGALCRVLLTRKSRAEERALHKQIATLPSRVATNDENNIHADETEQDETIVKYEKLFDLDNVEADSIDTREELRVNTQNVYFDTTCDALRKSEDVAPEQDESLSATRKLMCFSDSNTDSEDFDTQTTSQGEFPISEPVVTYTGYKFKHKSLLARHMRTPTGMKPYICKFCHSKCASKNKLVEHMRTHTGEKPFACELCQYKCSVNSSLVNHMRTHTGEKPYACELCQYKCSLNSSLVKHMRTHTGETPFACKLCQYKCTEKSNLVKHMRTHTGEKPFACKLCPYKCTQKVSLVRHMRTHTGEKPYACELCNYKCTDHSSLMHHMRTHTGEKPFACKICHYKFSESSTLVRHMRTHTGEKSFACELCQYKFSHKHHLVRHMRTHTGESSLPVSRLAHRSKSGGGVSAEASVQRL